MLNKKMSDKKYQQIYRIPSTRYKSHSYDGGIYFVTICTENKEHYFGMINEDSTVVLSEIGQFTTEQILKTKELRKDIDAEIPVFVVMPNHVHLIVCIDSIPRRDALNASQLNASHQEENESANVFGPQRKNLASIIRGIKSSVTGFANKNNIKFAWQSRFHDRIVRNYHELNRIADYIENNPFNWKNDDYY